MKNATAPSPPIHCAFCGTDFPPESAAQSACATCLIGRAKGRDACGFRKCPNCGYEIPVEPRWIAATRTFFAGLLGRASERVGA